jgi:hypothetical protein
MGEALAMLGGAAGLHPVVAAGCRTGALMSTIWVITSDVFIAMLGDRCRQNGVQSIIHKWRESP